MAINIEIIPYNAFPCNHKVFKINGIDADKNDFGYMEDVDLEHRPDYGCGDYKFIPYNFEEEDRKYELMSLKSKYGIDECEIYEIQCRLSDEFHVGCCSWCS
ncbi:MAG: hypothetical protein MJZ34_07445 [Paludibacteraceae bacterium]|nr:hypothetical protein [Paludibacteraceae bacterium]